MASHHPRARARRAGLLLAAVAGLVTAGLLAGSPTGAAAAPGSTASIAHVERTADGFSLVVDVPAGTTVDTSQVTARVNGVAYPASAQSAGTDNAVSRTAVLAIDTSDSMAGTKFTAAKQAATAFIDDAPSNVAIGIVDFNSSVNELLAPSTDRAKALSVLGGLRLSRGTKLFDGVLDAVRLTGTEGQRTVVVLSDGADTDSASTANDVTNAAGSSAGSGATIDVVALDQSGPNLAVLRRLAVNGGSLIPANDKAIVQAFANEAAVLKRQVAVTIAVPTAARDAQATLSLSLGTSSGALTTQATLPSVAAPEATNNGIRVIPPPADSGLNVPHWVMYAGVGVFGVGLLVALVLLVPAKPVPLSAEERVSTYATTAVSGQAPAAPERASEPALAQASQAVAEVLKRNRGLDERISVRLDAAGSELKSSEWLLLHAGIFLGVSVLGLLISGGNVVIGLLFIVAGAIGPWLYLGFRAGRRRKAFNAALPDTLQLMSGSLSAGLSLAQSVDTIVREGADPIAGEFRRVLVETRLGVPLEDAFDGVAERFDSEDFRWVVMAIRIQRQVGGNLAELLDTVGGTMRERDYMRRQVAALSAEGKLSAYVLGGLPPIFMLYLLATNRTYVMPLFTQPLGWLMLGGAITLLSVGIFWMSRLIKVEV